MNSRLRKRVEFFLLVLLLSAFLIPYSNVLGESIFSPQLRIEALLAIVETANETVIGIFRDLRSEGLQIPQEALISYEDGLAKAEESLRLYNSWSYEDASRVAVEALKKFKESLYIVYNEIEEPAAHVESDIEIMIRLNNSIIKEFRYLIYIENIAHILESKGYNITVIENIIQSTRVELNKALDYLRRHMFKSTVDILLMVKDTLGKLTERLRTISSELKVSRIEAYINDKEERLDLLKEKVLSLSSELSPEAQNASLVAIQDAEDNLDNARSYLEAQMVNKVITELVQSKKNEEEALRIISENQTSGSSMSNLTNSSHLEKIS